MPKANRYTLFQQTTMATPFLESQLQVYAPNTHPGETRKPNPVQDAKYHLLHVLNDLVKLADKVRSRLKDEDSLTDFFDSVIPGKKPVLWKEMVAIKSSIDSAAGKLGPAAKALQEAEARKAAREERKTAKTVTAALGDPTPPTAAPDPRPARGGAGASATDSSCDSEEHRPTKVRKSAAPTTTARPLAGATDASSESERRPTKVTGGARAPAGAELADGAAAPKAPKRPVIGKKDPIGKAMREAAWDRWIGAECGRTKCPVCQDRNIRPTDFSAGHILAESCGGATSAENLLPICSTCNVRMSTENLYDFCKRIFGRDIVLPTPPTTK